MKKISIIILALIYGNCLNIFSQLDNVTKILEGGIEDANTLTKAYMEPFGKGFALDLSNGWYNTASTHGTLGFDITLSFSMATIPSSLKTYDVTNLGLSKLTAGPIKTGPTIAGKKEDGADLILTQNVNIPGGGTQSVTTSFKMPKGMNVPFVPSAMIQGGLGLPKGIEIMVRYMPTIKIGDYGKLGLWGVGLKHDIKQWIPVVNKTPFWSMSILLAYTSFKTSTTGQLYTPDPNNFYLSGVNMSDYDDQGVELQAKAFNASLLLSTNIPVINVYGGIGIVSASSKLLLTGLYPIPDIPKDYDVAQSIANGENIKMGVKNIKDPINIKMSSKSALKATIGLRLKLAVLTLHGDYSICDDYKLISAGIGFSFR